MASFVDTATYFRKLVIESSFTETLVERSSQYFIVTVVFGPAINTVVFPKCSHYYMQSRFLLEQENKRLGR